MVIIKNKDKKQTYMFPKTYRDYELEYTIEFKNIERGFIKREVVVSESNLPYYYAFNLSFSDFEDGEYEYTICGKLDDRGIIRVGNVKENNIKRNINKDKSIQYEG